MKKTTALSKNGQVPGNRVKSFVKANVKQCSFKNTSSLFNEETPRDDIDPSLIHEARKTGILNLTSRNLTEFPAKVWTLNDIQKEEVDALSVSLDSSADQRWWEFQELQKLLIANNCITEIPTQIQSLSFLQVLDIHDNRVRTIPSEICCLNNLVKLNLNRNRIELLPPELYSLKTMNELRIGYNNLKEISSGIGNFVNLSCLELCNNELTMLPPDIGFLSSLNTLNLSKNKLTRLPGDFCGLTGLRHLDLSENLLSDVGSLFSDFLHLEILYLQQNKLKRIPVLQNAAKLTEIYLRHNQVREFSSQCFAPTVIQLIDLRANKVTKLDIVMDDLEQLDRIYLDNNDIETIPAELAFLPSLKQLTLEGNPLKGVRVDILQRGSVELLKYLRSKHAQPPFNQKEVNSSETDSSKVRKYSGSSHPVESELAVDIHKLKASGQLTISSKKIKELPAQIFITTAEAKVSKVNLSHNLLTALPPTFEKICINLRELNLDHNKFTELPACIGLSCPHLYYLTFQNNQIKDLQIDFANLKQLREINFSYNKFTSIPSCLYELPLLEIILAQDNKIESIDVDKLKQLPKLATLSLENNNISLCPPELGYLPLQRLTIQGNAFRIPGYQILTKGTEATLLYLRNRIVPPK